MANRRGDFKWYDWFFMCMRATSTAFVVFTWEKYQLCVHPLHIWIVVDFTTVFFFRILMSVDNGLAAGMGLYDGLLLCMFVTFIAIEWKSTTCMYLLDIWLLVDFTTVFFFRILMFVDNYLAAGMGLDRGWQQRYKRFYGRIVVLSVLTGLLYPFLWAWTIIGTIWFTHAKSCLPEDGQKWGSLIWLVFNYCGLVCIACICIGKWLTRRHTHSLRAQQGIPVSEFGVVVDMVRVPDWALEAAAQREAVEALIQELPKFGLKAVPTDCSECPICLEEFHVGNEVRGLPCAHNFHVECIYEWLRLNVKCPSCRCSVFRNLDLSALSNIQTDSVRSSTNVITTTQYVRSQPSSQSYLLRLQGLLRPIHTENGGSASEADSVETSSGRRTPLSTRMETVQVVVEGSSPHQP